MNLHHESARKAQPWRFLILPLLMFLASGQAATADQHPIQMDGFYSDWEGIEPVYVDPSGDGGASGIDLGRLWIADDDAFLYMRFEVATEIQLNSDHQLRIYIDTDNNQATGLQMGGIGADLIWNLGAREGTFWVGGGQIAVRHAHVLFRGLPSFTADEFEVAFGRHALPDGSTPLFPSSQIKVMLYDFVAGGDMLPDPGTTLTYTFDQGTLPPETAISLAKQQPDDVRVISFNVLQDGLWHSTRGEKLRRQVQAVQPQIINFQEIYNHTPTQTRNLVESWLPSEQGQFWFSGGTFDCHTVSRYPIQGSWNLDGNTAFLLNTTSVFGKRTLLINLHLPAGTNEAGRQAQVDKILAFIRDAKEPGGTLTLEEGSPIIIVGDTNFVGDSQQLRSLLTGDIVDNAAFGPDFNPDWDGTDLADLLCRQTEKRTSYTWRNDSSYFWPGRLDYIIYTDSALDVGNRFILYPRTMSPDSLAAHGLFANDHEGSDHLMVSADFRLPPPASVEDETPLGSVGARSADMALRLMPNPSSGEARIGFRLDSPGRMTLEIFDPAGRLVARPFSHLRVDAGEQHRQWDGRALDGSHLPSGIYFVRLWSVDEGRSQTVRWIRIR